MSDWPATTSAIFAGLGLCATAWQLERTRRQGVKDRLLETAGVSASWNPPLSPRPSDVGTDGFADWRYQFTVNNPGRFPISSIVLRVDFPVAVQRVRGHDLDNPAQTIEMVHPVLPGGGRRTWERTLRMKYADATGGLHGTTASVTFIDADGDAYTTHWPRATAWRGATAADELTTGPGFPAGPCISGRQLPRRSIPEAMGCPRSCRKSFQGASFRVTGSSRAERSPATLT
jgi:hypothetical protein